MHAVTWRHTCAACEGTYDAGHLDYCSACGGPVLAEHAAVDTGRLAGDGPGVWRYAAHLPPVDDAYRVTLGEGATPVLEAPELARALGVGRLLLLCDHLNPSGSFKDRALAVAVSRAVAAGSSGVVCASSGNAAGSAAAYAARAGLSAVLVVPERVPSGKLALARSFGARPLRVPGDYSRSFAMGRELARRLGYHNVSTTFVNPAGVAAYRSVAFDIVREVSGEIDAVFVPTGAGPLVQGVVGGFRYLHERGDVAGVPQVMAVQAAGCAPIVAAYEHGHDRVEAWPDVTTAVSGIDDPLRGYPGDGTATLAAVRATGGAALAVEDTEIAAATELLAHRMGQCVEPAAASALAGLRRWSATGRMRESTAVCLLTGHGLKTMTADSASTPLVDDVEEAAALLAG